METKSILRNSYEFVKTIALVFIFSFLIRTFLVQTFVVQGKSMEPNYQNRDYLLVDKVSYRFSDPRRGHIVVFRNPENRRVDFVKRIIGLPGEAVSVADNRILINGKRLEEEYLAGVKTEAFGDSSEIQLSNNEYFLLGDNRENSLDSRRIGPISRADFIGHVFLRVLPPQRFSFAADPSF
ncbi:signal peptidase I [Candidatus Berkelbacteria bacterium]|nr:signal peptidase I [Candidatus Berkelbacteria bacterium]